MPLPEQAPQWEALGGLQHKGQSSPSKVEGVGAAG